MSSIPLADNLIRRFQTTFAGIPKWAWQFEPPIPLIGRSYRPGRSILIYASAENFNRREWRRTPPFLKPPDAWNRYRVQYEREGRASDSFFPHVGIQPANDGGLFAAALFVSMRLGLPTAARPRTLLEKIATSNWCKFSIRAELNRDYIGNLPKLIASLPYVVGELVPTEAELARREGRSYEPASALLERIRAERGERTSSRKPGGKISRERQRRRG